MGHDQLFFGAGHGDVEQTHFLGHHLFIQRQRDSLPGQGGKLNHRLPVQPLGAKAQLGVEQNPFFLVGLIKLPPQAAQKDDRVFQPLGAVDGQQLDPSALLGGGRGCLEGPAFPHPVQMEQETKQALVTRALKAAGQLVEGQEIFPAFFPTGHSGEDLQQVRFPIQIP